jgi:hypothetical protein
MPMTRPASPGAKLRNHIRYSMSSTFLIAGTGRPDAMTTRELCHTLTPGINSMSAHQRSS